MYGTDQLGIDENRKYNEDINADRVDAKEKLTQHPRTWHCYYFATICYHLLLCYITLLVCYILLLLATPMLLCYITTLPLCYILLLLPLATLLHCYYSPLLCYYITTFLPCYLFATTDYFSSCFHGSSIATLWNLSASRTTPFIKTGIAWRFSWGQRILFRSERDFLKTCHISTPHNYANNERWNFIQIAMIF